MKLYDARCPYCGKLNVGLFLEETDGWIECNNCVYSACVLMTVSFKRIPIFTGKELARAATANPV